MSADGPDDIELAAYLAGDLDELAARRIEARLAEDPELGRRLDRLHGVLLQLRDPDAVEPPPGLSERLSERLDAEPGPTAAQASGGRLDGARDRGRLASLQRYLGTAAAAVVALVLLGGGFLVLSTSGGEDSADVMEMEAAQDGADAPGATEDSGEGDAGMDRPPAEESGDESADDAGEAESFEEGDSGDAAEGAAPRAPTTEIPRDEAEETADERWRAMPGRYAECRGEVEEAAPGPAVPVDVTESRTDPRVRVYEVVTVVGSGDTLDRAAWVSVDAEDCDLVEFELGE